VTGRHHRDSGPDPAGDLHAWYREMRSWYAVEPAADVPTCPRCGAQRPIDYGAKVGCGSCGWLWQNGAASEPALSPVERFRARRRLDDRCREDWERGAE